MAKENKRMRHPCQIEVKVRPDGIIPKEGKRVREVSAAFYSNEHTKENAVLVGKQLDQRRDGMKLHQIGKGSISYIMDCQSSKALESLMSDYSSGSLHRMVKSTFMSDRLLDEIGALYLSLGTSIDHTEYLLCQEELADTEGEKIYHLSVDEIEEMNQKIESEIPAQMANVTVKQAEIRQKARDRDILRGMSVEEDKARASELDELMNEWIQIKEQLQQLNDTHSDLVFDRREFTQNVGAIVDEVDIPLEIKQELMAAFLKFLPVGTDKTNKPGQKLVIEGDLLMEYVENTILDFNIPTETKEDMKERFRMMIKKKSGKSTVTESLAAKQEI
ncbi:uncharacterized protein [Ptychodera flava]|uniref:uncharacterized protein n=1 Tax=Ptychodera flava TaxID=63121 RepID=UPI003969D99D